MGVALSTQLPPLVINDSAPRLVVPPACPVCRDLKLELLDRGYRDHERLLSIDFQHILEQKKSCQTCRYILHMVLVMSKPLFARDGSYVSLFQSSRLKFRFLVGYTTRVMVVRKLAILLVFELYTPAGLPVAVEAFGTAPDRPPILDIITCTRFIQRNINNCKSSHPFCEPKVYEMPTRLLYIGRTDFPYLRLIEKPSEKEDYIAVSHCWGDKSQILTTTKSTLRKRLSRISWDSLSKTFQDAITISRFLNIEFLWIDSLCIIQDEASDWERESVKMAQVYSQAYLTIAAAGASSGAEGCLFRRQSLIKPGFQHPNTISRFRCDNMRNRARVNARYRCQSHIQFDGGMNLGASTGAPLWTRAWAFQERYLSNRTIHFHAEEMIWECLENKDCECGYYAWEKTHKQNEKSAAQAAQYYDFQAANSGLRNSLSKARRREGTRNNAFKTWLQAVKQYTKLDITHQLDKLPAISGVAGYIAPAMGSRCVAGIWEYETAIGLMWRKGFVQQSRRVKCTARKYIPTWSWASVEILSHKETGMVFPFSSDRSDLNFVSDNQFSSVICESYRREITSFLTIEDSVLRAKGRCITRNYQRGSEFGKAFLIFHTGVFHIQKRRRIKKREESDEQSQGENEEEDEDEERWHDYEYWQSYENVESQDPGQFERAQKAEEAQQGEGSRLLRGLERIEEEAEELVEEQVEEDQQNEELQQIEEFTEEKKPAEILDTSGHLYEDISPGPNSEQPEDGVEVICVLLGTKIMKQFSRIREVPLPDLITQIAIVLQPCGPEIPGRYRRIGLLEIENRHGWFEKAKAKSFEIV